jgi:hypothetical protein
MNYVLLKSQKNKEIRIYTEKTLYEGVVIYKGHKLSLEKEMLISILEYRESSCKTKLSFLKYDNAINGISPIDRSMWITANSESFDKEISESWNSVKKVLEDRVGQFRKILITVVNI